MARSRCPIRSRATPRLLWASACWGRSDLGQVGQTGPSGTVGTPRWIRDDQNFPLRARSVASGDKHGCLVTDDGDAYCWANNASGQVGDGTGLDFLNYQVGAITGTKYFDQDGSGTITADDIELEGWTITLYDGAADNGSGGGIADDGILQAGEIAAATAVATTTTDSNGDYTFNNLTPGDYFIVETLPSGWTAVNP